MKSLMELAAERRPAYGVYIGDGGVALAEMAAYAGFAFMRVDCEHAMNGPDDLKAIIRIADAAGIPTLVRVSSMSDITKLLDFGAAGILVPDVANAGIAREAVRLCKYAPVGQRGMGNVGRKVRYGSVPLSEQIKKANGEICLTVQIESVEGVENIDEILAVEGIDAVTTGVQDLSQSMGVPGKTGDPRVAAAQDTVIRKAVEKGIPPLITAGTPEQSKALERAGVYLHTICFDGPFIMKSFAELIASFRG